MSNSTCRIPFLGKWRYQCCTLDTWSRIQTLLSDNWMSRCHWTPTVTTWYSAILFVCLLWRMACHTELQTTTPAELVWRRTVASWSFPANIINVWEHKLSLNCNNSYLTVIYWQSCCRRKNQSRRASSFSAMTFCTQRKKSLSNWTINSNF